MEHSLQVFLVAVIASSLTKRETSFPFWISLFTLPLIRYEGLAISVPVILYLILREPAERPKALRTGFLLMGTILLYSFFLSGLGLGYLPSSVFAKQSATTAGSAKDLLKSMIEGLIGNIYSLPTFTVYSIALASGFAAWPTSRLRIMTLLGTPAVLHLCLGRNGWFGRYEVYILLYLLIISAGLLTEKIRLASGSTLASSERHAGSLARLLNRKNMFALLIIIVIGTKPLWDSTMQTPLASKNIKDQQIQMALITSQYLNKPVAVNDLGAVGLSSSRYVLDLWGLGSYEALSLRRDPNGNTRLWIPRLMKEKGVDHAIIYESWFPETPANWIKVAQLRLPGRRVTPASDLVTFYATSPSAADEMAQAISRYIADHSSEAKMISILPFRLKR